MVVEASGPAAAEHPGVVGGGATAAASAPRAWYGNAGGSRPSGEPVAEAPEAVEPPEEPPSTSLLNGVTAGTRADAGTDPWIAQDPWSTSGGNTAQVTSSHDGWHSGQWQAQDWSRYDWSDSRRDRGWWHADWQWSSWGANNKPDFSDPPSWPGWGHRRLWIQAVRRWDKQTDVPVGNHRGDEPESRSA